MRIALVSTMRTSVPPPGASSVELVVSLLADELARRGHDVTLFATADSKVSTKLVSLLPTGYRQETIVWDWELAEFMQLGEVYARAEEFDVIHSHVYCWALPFTRLVKTPTVHTFHICPSPDFIRYCRMYPEGTYVALSESHRLLFKDVKIAATIHNGIATSTFPFSNAPGTYLAYLGDIRKEKGPLECIRLAREVGIPLRIAGPESPYCREAVLPHVDGKSVVYLGEVDHRGKVELLTGAIAMIFPVTAPEAFGLVILESMACGTPVLGISSGPVPELIRQGVGGIHVSKFEEMAEAVNRISQLDRAAVRQWVVNQFDVSIMVDKYERVYEEVVANSRRGRR